MASQPIYQIHAQLEGYQPQIWRKFQVLNHITMARLGYILMSMFEMEASHLFSFDVSTETNFINYLKKTKTKEELKDFLPIVKELPDFTSNKRFEIITEDTIPYSNSVEILDATMHKIKDVFFQTGDQMNFNYDFGDDWNIHLVLEEILVDKELPGKELPRILQGEGYGIIEDCGGVFALEEIAKAFKKKKGSLYKEMSEWLDTKEFDMTAFDIDDANLRVKKIPRIYADIYEHDLEPTKASWDFLERKYLKNK